MDWSFIWESLTRGTVSALSVLALFWKGDSLLSSEGAEALYERIWNGTAHEKSRIVYERYFGRGISNLRFAVNLLLFSCVSLILAGLIYISLAPGFWDQLIADEFARSQFLNQVLWNGIPIVYIANFVTFALYEKQKARDRPPLPAFWLDLVTKALVFIVTTTIIYVLFALFYGAFSGDVQAAVFAVPSTIALAAVFGNLTGVYLYATALSSLPIFLDALAELMSRGGLFARMVKGAFFYLPFRNKPIRALAIVLSALVGSFMVIIGALVALI